MITYAPYHRWLKPAVEKPESLYSSNNEKRIRSTLPRISDQGITHEFKPLDAAFLSWFVPMYESTISDKKNSVVHDVYETTLGNKNSLSEYWSLAVYEKGEPVGGTVIGVRADRIMIVYRIYKQKWSKGTLQANPSLYSEYLVSKYAFDTNKSFVSHGKDRNPYGLNANIGLAIFKLSVGCAPSIIRENDEYTPTTIDVATLDTDALILHYPNEGDTITTATLVTARDTEEKYAQLVHYPELLKVTTIYRD
jgi:hypothetical protein